MNAMMKRIFVVLSNPFVILAIVNMLFAYRIEKYMFPGSSWRNRI